MAAVGSPDDSRPHLAALLTENVRRWPPWTVANSDRFRSLGWVLAWSAGLLAVFAPLTRRRYNNEH